jgi:hypothetical protein
MRLEAALPCESWRDAGFHKLIWAWNLLFRVSLAKWSLPTTSFGKHFSKELLGDLQGAETSSRAGNILSVLKTCMWAAPQRGAAFSCQSSRSCGSVDGLQTQPAWDFVPADVLRPGRLMTEMCLEKILTGERKSLRLSKWCHKLMILYKE